MSQEENKVNIAEFLESCPTDDKGRKIVPDEFMAEHYKDLPEGTINESRNRITYNGGMICCLDNSPEAMEARRKGGLALQAKYKERRTFAETIEYMLAQKADPEDIDKFNLPGSATKQDVIMAAMLKQSAKGNVKASTFLRDTIGQQPINRQEITAEITAEDKALIERVSARLQGQEQE